jgi:hypothetical protein
LLQLAHVEGRNIITTKTSFDPVNVLVGNYNIVTMMISDFTRMSMSKDKPQNQVNDRNKSIAVDLDFASKSLRSKGALMIPISQSNNKDHHIRRISQKNEDRHISSSARCNNSTNWGDDDRTSGSVSSDYSRIGPNRVAIITTLVMFLGALGAAIFVGYGIQRATQDEATNFASETETVALELEVTLIDYVRTSKWLHQACSTHDIDREEFFSIYQYISTTIDTEASGSYDDMGGVT